MKLIFSTAGGNRGNLQLQIMLQMPRSIRNINIPPPGKPRAFECLLCQGSREFDLKGHPGGGEFDFAWVGWGIGTERVNFKICFLAGACQTHGVVLEHGAI